MFKHPTELACPIVMHFVLINKTFKQFKKPGKCFYVQKQLANRDSGAERSRAEQGRAEQSRAEQSRAGQGREQRITQGI